MGFEYTERELIIDHDIKKLNKKVGKIIVTEPTESDVAEGSFMAQVWFFCENGRMYLIKEWDVRK